MITSTGGWFVSSSHDEFRADLDINSIRQVLRGVGGLLLSEPEERLAPTRARLQRVLGADTKLVALVPEFEVVLGVTPEASTGDLHTYEDRLVTAIVNILRITAEARPLVVAIDDLHWASPIAIAMFDAIVLNAHPGLIIVGSYRDDDEAGARPWVRAEQRWQRSRIPSGHIVLGNLSQRGLTMMLADMLRSPILDVADLAAVIMNRTGGNPFDTIELVNA